jgi:hypothetical protein
LTLCISNSLDCFQNVVNFWHKIMMELVQLCS